ncbi:MAG: PEP-utilizing enzyme [candidate division WOR-3 bacterium]|nr:PEP-utilizing enzyme [candidate division WOR-3 bacterium]
MIKLKGEGINPKFAVGEAKVIHTSDWSKLREMAKEAQEKVIVIPTAVPEYFIFLQNNCAGIISDAGTKVGHLASLMYHYNKPGLFGAENATQIIKDGMWIVLMGDEAEVYDKPE